MLWGPPTYKVRNDAPLGFPCFTEKCPSGTLGQSFAHRNRFDKLRESSPASYTRDRTESNASQKRKVGDDDDLYSQCSVSAKVCRFDPLEDEEIAILESKMTKVSTMCGKMLTNVQQLDIADPLRVIIADLIKTVRITNEVQEEMNSRYRKSRETEAAQVKDSQVTSMWVNADFPPPPQASARDNRKKLSGGLVQMATDNSNKSGGKGPKIFVQKPQETEDEKKHRKFCEAIKDAERSTLCFNLDMGNTPIMNKQSMSEKASMALAKMAASVEGKRGPIPSQDKIEALDDITSMVTNMEFYGTNTKEYKGKDSNGKENPGFCTVPVKYQFKDREQRVFSEKSLRENCKVKCSTPYPAIVRECIKQVVDHVCISHPKDFVRVNVVLMEFALKVSRRAPGKDLPWYDYPDLLRLPNKALDVKSRKVPQGLRMFFLPSEPQESMMCDNGSSTPEKGKNDRNPVSPVNGKSDKK